MKHSEKIFAIISLITLLTLSGCGISGNSIPSEIVVSGEDSLPEHTDFPAVSCGITLEKAVEKAVSLSPAATEIICELGFKSALVGVSDYCDFPANLSLPTLGSPENPDIDGIIKLEPDAVFTLSPLSERETYNLKQAGIAVLNAPMPSTVEEFSDMYTEISRAFFGKKLTDDEKETEISTQIGKNAGSALEKAGGEVRLGTFVYVTNKLTIAGADTFESAVLSLSGSNLCTDGGYIAAENYSGGIPDYIIADSSLARDDINKNSVLADFLKNGSELRFADSRCFERPTARTAEVFAEISKTE